MNLRDHTLAWLESVGADGLMSTTKGGTSFFDKGEIEQAVDSYCTLDLVPAFRHADGTYHTEPEGWHPCKNCSGPGVPSCKFSETCRGYQSWLAHKEATK